MRLLIWAAPIVMMATVAFAQPLAEVGNYGENIGTVAVDGTKGVINEGTSLRVVDLGNPMNPVFTGSVALGVVPEGLFVAGNYVYVAGHTGPFGVVNIASMDAPSISGSIDWEAWNYAVWVRRGGDFAYLGVCETVEVIDVRNKTVSTRVRSLGDMGACVESITGDGGYLYVVTDGPTTRVRIYSLVDPANPFLLAMMPGNNVPSRRSNSVAVFGDVLYVGQENGTQAYDITDRTSPRLIGRVENEDRYYESSLDVDRGLLYVANWGRMDVWQLASPEAPSSFKHFDATPQHQSRQVAAYSGLAVTARTYALSLENPSAGTSTVVRSITPGTGWVGTLAAKETILYLETGPGIAVLDISNPTQPVQVQHLSTRWSGDLEIIGNSLYNLSGWGFLEVYDITTASTPTYLAGYSISGGLDTLRLSGTSTLVDATAGDRLVIYSRAPNGTLTERSSTTMPTGGGAVAIKGSMAYVALTNGALSVYDLANPASPSLMTTRTVFATGSGFNVDAEVVGDRLHLLYGRTGYALLDISIPATPMVLGTFPAFEMEGKDIAVDGSIVYLSTNGWHGRRGIRALNISNPASIQQVATVTATGNTRSLLVTSGFLFSTESQGGLRVRNLAMSPSGLGTSGLVIH